MEKTSLLRAKDERGKPFRGRFRLVAVLAPLLVAASVLLGVFPGGLLFVFVLILTVVFTVLGVAYCVTEARSLRRFAACCTDERYPCAVVSEYRNLEFLAADAEAVRGYAELELRLYAALYKEKGRGGARPVSDAERKALKEQEKVIMSSSVLKKKKSKISNSVGLIIHGTSTTMMFVSKILSIHCSLVLGRKMIRTNSVKFSKKL